jgi:hypothetical protein
MVYNEDVGFNAIIDYLMDIFIAMEIIRDMLE